ncbi:MAG: FAD-dependent oxidoreductase [Candidatus Polarisedimenticolia bacterium]
MKKPWRVAVVGGGPAGATCARLLARSGARVTLFEASPGQEKPCGGGVPASALREFPELTDPALPRRVSTDVVMFGPSDVQARLSLRGGLHLFARRELDAFLRARARVEGAEVVETRVTSARRGAGGLWELSTDQGAAGPYDRLVAADGVHGAIGRQLAGPFPEEQLTLAIYAYVPVVPRGEVVLKFFDGFNGYLWVFPRRDHLSVGICGLSGRVTVTRLKEELHRFIETHHPEARVASGVLKGYFIPASPRPPRRLKGTGSAGGWAMVGDTGGFVDPLTREGIAHAMRSSVTVASRMAQEANLATPELHPDLRWAHAHGSAFYRGDFLDAMTRLAGSAPAIRRVLADLLTGDQSYRGLKRRLLLNAIPCGMQVGFRTLAAIVAAAR